MILLDTHAWIWWLAAPEKLSQEATTVISKAERTSYIGVAAISCWEVAMLVARSRIALSIDVESWVEKSLALPEVKFLELTPHIAIMATRLAGTPPTDPADRMLIATAQAHRIPLITKDERIRHYPHIESIW